MVRVVVSPAAAEDLAAIFVWTEQRFGPESRTRYQTLVSVAIKDLAEDPERPGTAVRPEIAANVRTYHLFHCRREANRKGAKISRPRHFLLYRISPSGDVEIGRILHDSMDLPDRLPPGYAAS